MPTVTASATVPRAATAVDLPVASDEIKQLPASIKRVVELHGFEAKVGQTMLLAPEGKGAIQVLVGIGPRKKLTSNELRTAAAAFARSAAKHESIASTLVEQLPAEERDEAIAAVVEGIGLATYRYNELKSKPKKPELKRVTIVAKGRGTKAAVSQAAAVVEAVVLARDLTNQPGGELTPEAFAARAKVAGEAAGLTVTVWDQRKIVREKLGGVIAVNQGSTHPARFVLLRYRPSGRAKGHVALVGKGITFDSGGLSLKTAAGMMTMKVDMAGGAAVLAAMTALGAAGAKVAVDGYIPLTDNMTGGDAQRPGDVFKARNGKTVEVLNTDAEGRLVLADALSLASETKPDAIIDIATLTGSASGALGTAYAAVMATDDGVSDQLVAASERTGEKVWRLPLPEEYRSQLDSVVADVKNIGAGPYGGALVAGLFLREFVADVPWAHIDLGLSALSETDKGITVKGATGFGVRLLIDTLANWDG